MLRILRQDIEPIRVIKCAGVNTDHGAETFEAQVELGPAILAEVEPLPPETCSYVLGEPVVIAKSLSLKIGSVI